MGSARKRPAACTMTLRLRAKPLWCSVVFGQGFPASLTAPLMSLRWVGSGQPYLAERPSRRGHFLRRME